MAFDAFLLFKKGTNALDVVGETLDKIYAKSVEISEFNFGVENTLSIGSAAGGAGAGKATFKEFTVKKVVDTASPALFKTSVVGGHYDEVKLYIRKAGGKSTGQAYLIFTFGTVAVKTLTWSGATGDDTPTRKSSSSTARSSSSTTSRTPRAS